MRIGYFIRNIGISGGVKVVLQHVAMLKDAGMDVVLVTEKVKTDWDGLPSEPLFVKNQDLRDMPDCDVYVGSVPNDVKRLHMRGKGIVVHLCQGYEPVEYRARLEGESITEKYARKGLFSFFERYADNAKFKKRIREIEAIYALPTKKAAVSRHLVDLIEARYKQKCALIQNGIDTRVFRPDTTRAWGAGEKIRILSVGSMAVGFKGIPDTLDAISLLRQKGVPIELIRVSPGPPSDREQKEGEVDRYLTGISEQEMAQLYRESDIFISSSLEGEGFGLPAIEALASGVPSILTEISTYRNFNEDRGYACFVPTHNPDRIAAGILAYMEDPSLRERHIERGFEVASRYTLNKTREDLLTFVGQLS
jgi:glycosyltransferase involved in cell wall biosynthesis